MSSLTTTVSLSGKEKREYAVNNIAYKLLTILHKHISIDSGISQNKLFKKLFKVNYNDDNLKHFVMWDFVKKGMHKLRRDSNCFVVGKGYGLNRFYYVVTNNQDIQPYIDSLKNSIKRMQGMSKRGKKAVDQEWYQETWAIEDKSTNKLR